MAKHSQFLWICNGTEKKTININKCGRAPHFRSQPSRGRVPFVPWKTPVRPANVEKIARFPGGEKKRRIVSRESRLWLSWFFRSPKKSAYIVVSQGQILPVWILEEKLPNSDLNFAVDFRVDFFLCFFSGRKAPKNPPQNPRQGSPGNLFRRIPLGFLQKPFDSLRTSATAQTPAHHKSIWN